MKINFKKLAFIIFITFFIANIFSIFINSQEQYLQLNKSINIPPIVFPIVWTILYFLMSISMYIISCTKNNQKKNATIIYVVQLILNSLWTLIFFGLKNYNISYLWILLLIVVVIQMIITFYKINKTAGLLNIPYLIWLIFAAYLNLNIIILN